MSLWYHFTQLEIVTITYLSITVFLWLPSRCHSTLLSSSSHHVPAKRKSDTWACIEIALIFTHHTLAGAMAFICKLWGTHTAWREAAGWRRMGEGSLMSGTGCNVPGRSWPNSLHPIPRLLPSSHWQAVDWGLRLAATFSQKAREIQYWEWMATSCCQCCNLGNRQSTILVPPLATGMVGKMKWIFSTRASAHTHTHTQMQTHTHTRTYKKVYTL